MSTQESVGNKLNAAYVSWGTFKNSIVDGLTEGLPSQIDKSIFPGMAGGVQGHLFAALKFLDLTDEKARPTAALRSLTVEDEEGRKQALGEILKSRYTALFSIGLETASIKLLLDTIEAEYGNTGASREKAARFFLSAAQWAGIPMSKYLANGSGISAGRKKSTKRAIATSEISSSADVVPPLLPLLPPPPPAGGERRIVTLKSGGTLTLSASVGFMKLAKSDRDFVFGLIDQLDDYESKNPTPPAEPSL